MRFLRGTIPSTLRNWGVNYTDSLVGGLITREGTEIGRSGVGGYPESGKIADCLAEIATLGQYQFFSGSRKASGTNWWAVELKCGGVARSYRRLDGFDGAQGVPLGCQADD